MSLFRACFIALSLAFVFGCGGPARDANSKKPPIVEASPSDLKVRLESFAQTGMVGSAVVGMKDAIQKLPPEKSGPLLEDFDKLSKTDDPNQVKAIAKRMLEKL